MKPSKFCEYCSAAFGERLRNDVYAKQRYCSPDCRNKARANLDVQECPTCGTSFPKRLRGKSNPKRYCSSECSFPVSQADRDMILFLYPMHGADAVAVMMGVDRSYVQRLANRHHVTLSTEASQRLVYDKVKQNMKTNNPMKSQKTRDKVRNYWLTHPEEQDRVMTIMRRESRKYQQSQPSKLEQRLRQYLTELGVEFEPSALIKDKFVVDIRIGNLIIEADGDWWHGHERYTPLNDRQLKQQKRDASRNKYLATCGYTVIRIWDTDMTKERVREILIDFAIIDAA